jgi:hypothetical protein
LAKGAGQVLFTKIYWYLEEYSCVLIERNQEWFRAAVLKVEELWKNILCQRRESTNIIRVIKV